MKRLPMIAFFLFLFSSNVLAYGLEAGKYVGTKPESEGTCSVLIDQTSDGKYARLGQSRFRVTTHTPGAFVQCEDYDGNSYDKCASGDHINGSQDRSLYFLYSSDSKIDKLIITGSVNAGGSQTCINMEKL